MLINLDNIKVGSDPEFFIKDETGITSSLKYVPVDKYSPIEINDYKIFSDNILVEGNIPPATTKTEFVNNMKKLKGIITDLTGCGIESKDSHIFSAKDLSDSRAKVFGCSPYESAWKKTTCLAASLARESFRTAGFHIHIGYEHDASYGIFKKQIDGAIAKAFDYYCVYPSRLISDDDNRNGNYGEYGAYRNKPYGVEVRSLGGFFTKDEYLDWVYSQTIKTMKFISDPTNLRKLQMLSAPRFTKVEYSFLNINLEKQIKE
jgi:hypothetical protein